MVIVLTAVSQCKLEGILKYGEINNTSFMCLYFAGSEGMRGLVGGWGGREGGSPPQHY
jgi:hypothetical protein